MKLTYVWIDADKPEEQFEVTFYAVGQQDDVSKAHGTALTYAERCFLMKFFNIQLTKMMQMQKKSKKNIQNLMFKSWRVKTRYFSFIDLMKER